MIDSSADVIGKQFPSAIKTPHQRGTTTTSEHTPNNNNTLPQQQQDAKAEDSEVIYHGRCRKAFIALAHGHWAYGQ